MRLGSQKSEIKEARQGNCGQPNSNKKLHVIKRRVGGGERCERATGSSALLRGKKKKDDVVFLPGGDELHLEDMH